LRGSQFDCEKKKNPQGRGKGRTNIKGKVGDCAGHSKPRIKSPILDLSLPLKGKGGDVNLSEQKNGLRARRGRGGFTSESIRGLESQREHKPVKKKVRL